VIRLRALAASIAAAGIVGASALREAAATELGQVMDLVRDAVRTARENEQRGWDFAIDSVFADRVVVLASGRYWSYPYTIGDDNRVALGAPVEVVPEFAPVGARVAEAAAADSTPVAAAADASCVFLETLAPSDGTPPRYLVRVIRAGTSLNGVDYPRQVLREAVPLFNGARVFVKSDEAHVRGDRAAKDFRQLVGGLSAARFVEAGAGEIQAELDVLETADVAPKLREAVARGMTDLFGLSIDAVGMSRHKGALREATRLTHINSVDLIIEPGAGGQVIRFVEAVQPHEGNPMLREQMLKFIEARDRARAESLTNASDAEILTAYREAVQAAAAPNNTTTTGRPDAGEPAPVTAADVDARIRMIEARAQARDAIAGSGLPQASRERLTQRFTESTSFADADVAQAITAEREYIGRITEGAQIRGLGSVEAGVDRADKVKAMFDDFFDKTKPAMSFREAYIEVTGDKRVTGQFSACDMQRLREAAGEDFREAVSASTFSNILGDSITRAMIREYGALEAYQDWRWICDVVPVSDFRSQQRTRMGGYGNLPGVNENAAYTALSSPTDEKATYAVTKRGGTETLSLEAIANDDVGIIRRIPLALATAAGRTLYEFVFNFLSTNAAIYDTKTLFHTDHANTGTAALDATSFAAARLAMKRQTEQDSGKRLGLTLRHLAIPADLEEAAFNLFVRGTNIDETFVQSRKPTVHVIDYWTDVNNWYATTDNSQCPLLEIGFYGSEQPELFVQDQPTQGSLFSNDQVKYKIRHIYGGAVRDWRGFYGAIVP